jgi:ubiquinone/menaquinone biosynthesis C-methylase UbiE
MDDYYSRIAEGYDELHGAEQDAKLLEFLERVELPQNAALLDVGCGTGRSERVLRQHADIHWHGIDPSPGLISKAESIARARILQAPAEHIPYPDASFDIILSLTSLQNFEDPAQGLDEMERVAKPGALFLISFLKKSQKAPMLDALIRGQFAVAEHWEEAKDRMYICTSKRI